MKNYNKCILSGNVVKDPEIRYTPQKQKIAKFTLAVGNEWKNRETNDKKTQTDFINIVAWGALADICDRYVVKGKPLLVDGRLRVRDYEKDGQRKWITEIVAETIQLLGSKNADSLNQPTATSAKAVSADAGDEFMPDFSDIDAELPF